MMQAIKSLLAGLVLFAGAALAGLVLLAGLFQSPLARQIEVLFYRGAVLCAVAALLLGAGLLLSRRVRARDALAAAILSFGLNLSFVVVLPVTVDRSISVFILGTMDGAPDRRFTTADIETAFKTIYVGELHQIERRMQEQTLSGNVRREGDGFVLTPQGRAFLVWGRRIGDWFAADRQLIDAGAPRAR